MGGEFLYLFCYQTKYFYILTLPKIASSWLNELTHTYPEIMDINSKNDFWASRLIFNQINLSISKNDEISSYNFNHFEDDWYKLINGNNEISRNFVFLLRNPVNKFISGTMQDVLYESKENSELDPRDIDSDEFLKYFVHYPNQKYLKKLKSLHDIFSVNNIHWWTLDGVWWDNSFLVDIIDYWIKKKLSLFFKEGFNLGVHKSGHKISNIYLYHKILFNSNIDKSKIKILDIDKENIYDYLVDEYNLKNIISDISYKEERNKTGRIFKSLIIKNIKEYSEIIETLLQEDILMYIDIFKKIYDIDLTYEDVFFKQLE